MKISFGEDLTREDSGKHKFLKRLAKSFIDLGIKIVPMTAQADIFLHIGRNISLCNAHKIIIRVDGLWLNAKDNERDKKNNDIKNNITLSDGVVFQGEFCKKVYYEFFGKDFLDSKSYSCISNGADPEEFLTRQPENFYLAYAHWRPHKRLSFLENCFSTAIINKEIDTELIIAGKCEKKKLKGIKYVGELKSDELKKYLSRCIATFNLSWLDWMPNSLIEGCVSKCFPIVSNSGGHAEIVKDKGILVKDKQWDGGMVDLYSPPPLDEREIIEAMKIAKLNPIIKVVPELYIHNVALKYIEFFDRVLNK